jgi:hypothetical protein
LRSRKGEIKNQASKRKPNIRSQNLKHKVWGLGASKKVSKKFEDLMNLL